MLLSAALHCWVGPDDNHQNPSAGSGKVVRQAIAARAYLKIDCPVWPAMFCQLLLGPFVVRLETDAQLLPKFLWWNEDLQ